jgi:subtilisin
MEAVAFVKMLHQSLSRSKPGTRRHILRVANASDYRTIAKTIHNLKGVYKRLTSVCPIPLIHAFSYQGKLPSALIRRFSGFVTIEEDVSISVHALPSSAAPHPSAAEEPSKKPFIPSGIRSLRVPAVWKRSLGARVRIGIIDTGVDYAHPDLQPVLSRGINLIHPRTLPLDDNGHGTHIAGTIAAAGRWAMTGIAPQATLLPVKAFDHNGSAYVSDIIKGIDWCVQNGVDIINMSFGMKKRSEAMLEAVRNARSSGVVIVASSGNDGRRGFIDYPARFPQTISVGALDKKGGIASFSNRGKRIDVYAPGEQVVSTWPNRRYHEMNGTSMATSHVTGILALVLSVRPRLTPLQIKRLIAAAQLPMKGQSKKARSPGRIDAIRAFRQLRYLHAIGRMHSD